MTVDIEERVSFSDCTGLCMCLCIGQIDGERGRGEEVLGCKSVRT